MNWKTTTLLLIIFSSIGEQCSAQDNGVCYKPLHDIIQKLPVEQILKHVNYGELNADWENYANVQYVQLYGTPDSFDACTYTAEPMNNSIISGRSYSIYCTNIWDTDTTAIYTFGKNSNHRYDYLLLKDQNKYVILNGENFLNEWQSINKLISRQNIKPPYNIISIIIDLYQKNNNTHSGMPLPVLRDSATGKMEMEYPPRMLFHTSPFFYPAKHR